MKMLKIIEKRRSVRDYRDKVLEPQDMSTVDNYINSVPQIVDGVTVTLRKIEDTQACFDYLDGHVGYHGNMIKAPHYVIVTATAQPHHLKAGGYAGEWFVLNLTREDIATCWISANNNEARVAEYLDLPENEEVVGIIGYGYAANEARFSNIYAYGTGTNVSKVNSSYSTTPTSGRISLEEIVHISRWGNLASVERLEDLGYDEVFYYMRLAPSSVNRQPWRFLIQRGKFVLCVSREDGYDDDRLALLEAGIAMLYFEVAMHDSGFPGHWYFKNIDKDYDIPEDYLVAAIYKFN